jgi:hypothetical protein
LTIPFKINQKKERSKLILLELKRGYYNKFHQNPEAHKGIYFEISYFNKLEDLEEIISRHM